MVEFITSTEPVNVSLFIFFLLPVFSFLLLFICCFCLCVFLSTFVRSRSSLCLLLSVSCPFFCSPSCFSFSIFISFSVYKIETTFSCRQVSSLDLFLSSKPTNLWCLESHKGFTFPTNLPEISAVRVLSEIHNLKFFLVNSSHSVKKKENI